jgi:hypothetical protein
MLTRRFVSYLNSPQSSPPPSTHFLTAIAAEARFVCERRRLRAQSFGPCALGTHAGVATSQATLPRPRETTAPRGRAGDCCLTPCPALQYRTIFSEISDAGFQCYLVNGRPRLLRITSAHSFTLKHTCDPPGQPAGLFRLSQPAARASMAATRCFVRTLAILPACLLRL